MKQPNDILWQNFIWLFLTFCVSDQPWSDSKKFEQRKVHVLSLYNSTVATESGNDLPKASIVASDKVLQTGPTRNYFYIRANTMLRLIFLISDFFDNFTGKKKSCRNQMPVVITS